MEQHPPRHAGLHQPVGLVDGRERLPAPGGHCDQHLPLPLGDCFLDTSVRFDLVRAKPGMLIRGGEQFVNVRLEVPRKAFFERERGWVVGHLPRPFKRVPNVVEPNDCAVRGVQERHAELAVVKGIGCGALGVALSLSQYVLRSQ